MDLEDAYREINDLPSMKTRMKVKNRNDIDEKKFCTVAGDNFSRCKVHFHNMGSERYITFSVCEYSC